jgi:hypothetical protein
VTFNLVPSVVGVPPSLPASGLFCGVQHRGKCTGIMVKTAFTGPGNAVWQFGACNPSVVKTKNIKLNMKR